MTPLIISGFAAVAAVVLLPLVLIVAHLGHESHREGHLRRPHRRTQTTPRRTR